MKNKIKKSQYIIIAIITLFIIIPFFQQSLKDTHDGGLHILRIIGVGEALQKGMFPPTISPNYCNTWGYAVNLFYNPLTTYMPLILNCIFNSYTICIKIFMGIAIYFAGIFMYNLAKEITQKPNIAIISSIIYITTPYYLSDIYIRGAVAEFVALTFIPLVFLGIYNLFEGDKTKHYYITIGTSLLFLTHSITTIYTAIFCVIYIIMNIDKLKDKTIWKKCFINGVFIILITSFFTVPLILNKINAEYTIFDKNIMGTSSKYLNYEGLLIKQLFVTQPEDEVVFNIGLPNIIGLLLCIFAYKNIDKKNKSKYINLCLLGILSIIMSTRYFPWFLVPDFFAVIQFPWRILGFTGIFLSMITAINLDIIFDKIVEEKRELKKYFIIPCICLILLNTEFINFPIKNEQNDIDYENRIRRDTNIGYFQINREYMPLKAYLKINDELLTRDNKIMILEGQAEIKNEVKQDLKVEVDLINVESNTKIEAPFLYYLGYKAYIIDADGNKQQIQIFESENGFVAVNLQQKGNIKLIIQYEVPISYYISIVSSLFGVISFLVYIKIEKNKLKTLKN